MNATDRENIASLLHSITVDDTITVINSGQRLLKDHPKLAGRLTEESRRWWEVDKTEQESGTAPKKADQDDYPKHDGIVHLPHPGMDVTMCGDAYEGNPIGGSGSSLRYEENSSPCSFVEPQKVTCPCCRAMASICRGVPDKFLK